MPGGSSGGQVYPGAQQNSGGTPTPWQSPWSGALLSSFFNGFGAPQSAAPAPTQAAPQSNLQPASPAMPMSQAAQAPAGVTAPPPAQPTPVAPQPVSMMQSVTGAVQGPPGVTAPQQPIAQPAPAPVNPTAFMPQNGMTAPTPQPTAAGNAFGMLGGMFPQNAPLSPSLGGGF